MSAETLGTPPNVPAARASRETAESILSNSGLPAELADMVNQVVRRARLWESERAEVARELCAHFRDGLESGATPQALRDAFGDPTRAAQLLTRARKRLRPLWWRASRRTVQGTAIIAGVVTAAYLALAARFFTGSPTIAHNYSAELNAAVDAKPRDTWAWPLYLSALTRLGPMPEFQIVDGFKADAPGDPDWDRMGQWLHEHDAEFRLIREAAAKPNMGFHLSSTLDSDYLAMLKATVKGYEPTPEAKVDNPLMVGVLLPHLGEMRKLARWLRADARAAAASHDPARFLADANALFDMASQCQQDGFIISGLVGVAIADLALAEVRDHALTPGLLSDAQLASLAHRVGGFAGGRIRLDIATERMVLDDVVQRFYTDDGKGGGHLVASDETDRIYRDFGVVRPKAMPILKAYGPVQGALLPSRRQMNAMITSFAAQAATDEALPPWRHDERRSAEAYRTLCEAGLFDIVPVLKALQGGVDPPEGSLNSAFASRDIVEARRGAVLALLAAEAHRRHTGAWPATLEELVPAKLPALPLDPFTGQPLRYLPPSPGAAVPTIYSVGPDGVDDHAEPPATAGGRSTVMALRTLRAARHPESVTSDELQRLANAKGDWVIIPEPPKPAN